MALYPLTPGPAEDLDRKKHQEEALTQVVNAHGGLMKMMMELHVGQSMLLVNPKNKVEQNCRVVRVDDRADGSYSVAFEFDAPNPKFWPVVFPPEDWNASRVLIRHRYTRANGATLWPPRTSSHNQFPAATLPSKRGLKKWEQNP